MKYLFFLVCLISFCSCTEKHRNYSHVDAALQKILNKDQLDNAHYCVVIPRAGCGGCIDNATMYVRDNINRFNKVEVVFTGVVDRKLLRLELGDTVMSLKNIHVDKSDLFQDLKVKSIYPQVVKIEKGNAIQINDLDVENNKMSDFLKD